MNLVELKQSVATCSACSLCEGRDQVVFDKGSPTAKIMICGMVPADEENKAGLPFMGKAGKLLDFILDDSALDLKSVYITNLVKCYLPAGKPLKKTWIAKCFPYLKQQIENVNPKVIITLGKDATCALLDLKNSVSLSGILDKKVYDLSNGLKVVPTYHPSYLIQGGGAGHTKYPEVIKAFLLARKLVEE